jgi:two-component system response regulator YesN
VDNIQNLNVFSGDTSPEDTSTLEGHDMEGIISLIINNVFDYDTEEITKNTHKLFQYIEQDNMNLLEDVKLKLMEIIFLIALKLKDKGIHIGSFNKLRILKTIESFSRFSDLKIWFKDELKQFSEDIKKNRASSLGDSVWYIEKAKAYINKEYDERITLNDISKYLHLNSVYFSISFKKKTGQNFIDYVNSVKIAKAKQFLLKPEHKAKEVALMVGYDDYSYFSKVFRKITGTTPAEYRASNHNN